MKLSLVNYKKTIASLRTSAACADVVLDPEIFSEEAVRKAVRTNMDKDFIFLSFQDYCALEDAISSRVRYVSVGGAEAMLFKSILGDTQIMWNGEN